MRHLISQIEAVQHDWTKCKYDRNSLGVPITHRLESVIIPTPKKAPLKKAPLKKIPVPTDGVDRAIRRMKDSYGRGGILHVVRDVAGRINATSDPDKLRGIAAALRGREMKKVGASDGELASVSETMRGLADAAEQKSKMN